MNICVFCGSSSPRNSDITSAAEELGSAIGLAGHTLLYGGSNLGLMGAVSGAALKAGGHVVAVIPKHFGRTIINSQPVSQLICVDTMAQRKEYLLAHSDLFVALPGGIGTLDEVLEVMVANQLGLMRDAAGLPIKASKPLLLFNHQGFFDPFVQQLEQMARGGFFRNDKQPSIANCATIKEIIARLDG